MTIHLRVNLACLVVLVAAIVYCLATNRPWAAIPAVLAAIGVSFIIGLLVGSENK